MKPIKVSNSRLDLYNTCPKKYYFRYVENLKGDFTSSALLFGTAIDAALNHILENVKDKKDWTTEGAKDIFASKMNLWIEEGNRLDFFKGDLPAHLQDAEIDENDPGIQSEVYHELLVRGNNCIDVYVREILPQIEEVISVQDKQVIVNEHDDEFTFILDYIVKLKDGKTVLMDNKTSSKRYPKNSVIKSQQLSLYLDFYPHIKYAGYAVLIKNPDREKGLTHQLIVDEIPEETRAESFAKLDAALIGIKNEEFPVNRKACKLYGKPCEYLDLCMYGRDDGLVPNRKNE